MEENEVRVESGTVLAITPGGMLEVEGISGTIYQVYRQNASPEINTGDRGELYQVNLPGYAVYRFVRQVSG